MSVIFIYSLIPIINSYFIETPHDKRELAENLATITTTVSRKDSSRTRLDRTAAVAAIATVIAAAVAAAI